MKILLIVLSLLGIILGSLFFLTSDFSINKAKDYALDNYLQDFKINKEKLKFESSGILEKDIKISYNDCIEYSSLYICFNEFKLIGKLSLLNLFNSTISKIHIHVDKGHFNSSSKEKQESEFILSNTISTLHHVYKNIKSFFPKSFKLYIDRFNLNDFLIQSKIDESKALMSIDSKDFNIKTDLKSHKKAYVGDIFYTFKNFKLKSVTKIRFLDNLEIIFNLNSSFNENEFKSKLSLNLNKSNLTVKNEELKIINRRHNINIQSELCSFIISSSSKHDLSCPKLKVKVKDLNMLYGKIQFLINDKISKGQIASNNIHIYNRDKKQFDFNLKLESKVFLSKLEIEKFDWLLEIKKFQYLVKKLKNTSFAIFAPFNTLNGSALFKSNKLLSINKEDYEIPIEASFNLSDKKKNAIVLDYDGKLFYREKEKPHVNGKINIKKLRVNIPDIDPIGRIPNINGSSRINEKIKFSKKNKPSPISYNFEIKTQNNESVKIYYYLIHPYLSFGVNAKLSERKISYKVMASDKFKVKYLKRKITHKKSLIQKEEDEEFSSLKTEFFYYAAGYRIILKVIGTLEAPRLILSSYPSLPREDIISLLIYNKRSSSITSGQRQSVGGTEAAIADKALSLFSIWAFASTPIDYVSYDPNTKSYSASISLPGNTSFQIGTDWESVNTLTLRKQLNSTWAIETTYRPNEENQGQDVMLQKEISF